MKNDYKERYEIRNLRINTIDKIKKISLLENITINETISRAIDFYFKSKLEDFILKIKK